MPEDKYLWMPEDKYLWIKQATKDGWIRMKSGGVCDVSYPTSKLRRGRVQRGGTFHQH